MKRETTRAWEEHRDAVFGMAYRMLGDADDAEDVVQETFSRLLERPPANLDRSLEPWLVRVAANLSIDHLRQRQREVTSIRGVWLPSPVPTSRVVTSRDPGQRLRELETATLAFLHLAESLTPGQRAVFLLRTLFEHTTRETAEALDLSESAVKTNLHRARAALSERSGPPRPVDREAILRLMQAFAREDHAEVESLLHEEVRAFTDGGGDFFAGVPQRGSEAIVRLLEGLASKHGETSFRTVEVNGSVGLAGRAEEVPAGWAPRFLLVPDVADGKVLAFRTILDPRKLKHGAGAHHLLLIGTTGMLAGAAEWLAERAHHATIVSRDDDRARAVAPHATIVEGDWTEPSRLAEALAEAKDVHGSFDLALLWIHRDGEPLWARLPDLLSPRARLFEVLGSASQEPSALDDHAELFWGHRRVVLGHRKTEEGRRWLTHDEISRGALEAIERDRSRVVGET